MNNPLENLRQLTEAVRMYNPQIQISAESETKRSIFREKDKTKAFKKGKARNTQKAETKVL